MQHNNQYDFNSEHNAVVFVVVVVVLFCFFLKLHKEEKTLCGLS